MDRKKEHIENCLKSEYKGDTLFDCVYIEHNALSDLKLEDINTKVDFFGKKINFPVYINAMTGGCDISSEINEDLARLAKEFGLPIALGSGAVALDDENAKQSFEVVRQILEYGVVMGNIGANRTFEEFEKVRKMIDADIMQIHLNMAQELAMPEGDRDFSNQKKNLEEIAKNSKVPIMVKEVGFGISMDVAKRLYRLGIKNIDISGFGGTNFMEIEDFRNSEIDFSDLFSWGIPTAKSIIDTVGIYDDLNIYSSGGIKTATDIVKSIILGAKACGISGEILKYLCMGGYESARAYMKSLIYKTKMLMLLLGKKNIEELKLTDYKLTGRLKELLSEGGGQLYKKIDSATKKVATNNTTKVLK